MITISEKEYDELVRAQMKLEALESEGVDNWQGWDDAMDSYRNALAQEGKDD